MLMKIIEKTSLESPELESFKSQVWPLADVEHYKDQQPKFFKNEFTLIAKDEDRIVGYISVIIDTGVAQIEPLMVKTELKGQGIGAKLLESAEEKAKELGVHKIWLETGSDWLAKNFYEKRGYIVRTVLPNHTNGREFVLMDKMI